MLIATGVATSWLSTRGGAENETTGGSIEPDTISIDSGCNDIGGCTEITTSGSAARGDVET
jgi:hypothetical protein